MKQASTTISGTESVATHGYWSLVAGGEPYRLLFFVGTVLGGVGVSLWPAHVWGLISYYPGQIHARIMVEGFLASFVVGFLGTALPRLLDVRPFSLEETLSFTVLLLGGVACHLLGVAVWGDYLFGTTILLLMGTLLVRFRRRKDTPPPAFVLVLLGLLCALSGAGIQVVRELKPEAVNFFLETFSRLLLYQGFLLLPVMGVGAFLLPRFLDLPNRQDFPESREIPAGWIRRAVFAGVCGTLVIASFVLEAMGQVRLGLLLRSMTLLLYFFRELPFYKTGFKQGALGVAVRLSLVAIPLGYLLMAVFPDRQAAFIHVVFISGFSLLTYSVASRVILGHSGQSHLFQRHLKSIHALSGLVILAMLTRVSADWLPDIRMSHLGYAAIVWILGVVLWSVVQFPYLVVEDGDH